MYELSGCFKSLDFKIYEVVAAFVVGHWAPSRNVGNSHVNYLPPPTNLLEVADIKIGDQYPITFYSELVKRFSKEGDTVLEVSSEKEVGKSIFLFL